MDLGVAGTVDIRIFDGLTHARNWLTDHADVEIIDIKFSTTDTHPVILIIFRKEV